MGQGEWCSWGCGAVNFGWVPEIGAGEGNRTLVISLEGCCSIISPQIIATQCRHKYLFLLD
jgi:hypothetical protein